MRVRAVQKTFQGGCLREVGAEFDVPEGTKLRTGKLDPVMVKVVGERQDAKAAPRPAAARTSGVVEPGPKE
ncbi:MAG: hypothetical protein V3S43_01085 [Acidimicrobiia bacterium]